MKTIILTKGICILFCLLICGCSNVDDIIVDTNLSRFGNTSGNIQNYGLVVTKDDWIYYTNKDKYDHLYKRKMDGGDKTKLGDDRSYMINILDNWIFYIRAINASDAGTFGGDIYRISIDGKNHVRLSSRKATSLIVTSKYIFFLIGLVLCVI